MEEDYYAPWEWQPKTRMPGGCNDVVVETIFGERYSICSCDYWWFSKEKKDEIVSFRFE